MALPIIEQVTQTINGVTVKCSHIKCTQTGNFRMENVLDVLSGGYFSWQMVAKASGVRRVTLVVGNVQTTFDLTRNWTRYVQILENVDPTANRDVYLVFPTGEYWLYHIMLEKGNKISEWRASPLDMEDEVADLHTEITEQYTQIMSETESIVLEAVSNYTLITDFETFKSENTAAIEITAENILSTVSETYETITDAGTAYEEFRSGISQNADNIELKVSSSDYNAATIAAMINDSGSSVIIEADHIQLSGDVVLKSNLTDGTTQISGSNILTGTIDASVVNVTNVNASNINSGRIAAQYIDAENIEIDSAQIVSGTIETARIPDLSAEKITSGTIDARNVTINNLNASNITNGTLSSNRIAANSISVDRLTGTIRDNSDNPSWEINLTSGYMTVGNISADNINSGRMSADYIYGGTISGENVNITNLSASNISGGTMSAGTIDASQVTISNLSANVITSGTIDASQVTINNLQASNITGIIKDGDGSNDNYWNLTTGVLKAKNGEIGGLTLSDGALYNGMTSLSDTSHNGVFLSSDGIALGKGKFIANADGSVTAKNIEITGGTIDIRSLSNTSTGYVSCINLKYNWSYLTDSFYYETILDSLKFRNTYVRNTGSIRNTTRAEMSCEGLVAYQREKVLTTGVETTRYMSKLWYNLFSISKEGVNVVKIDPSAGTFIVGNGGSSHTADVTFHDNVTLPLDSKVYISTSSGSYTISQYVNNKANAYAASALSSAKAYTDDAVPTWGSGADDISSYFNITGLSAVEARAYKYGNLVIINFRFNKTSTTAISANSATLGTAYKPSKLATGVLCSTTGCGRIFITSSANYIQIRLPAAADYYDGTLVYKSANIVAL